MMGSRGSSTSCSSAQLPLAKAPVTSIDEVALEMGINEGDPGLGNWVNRYRRDHLVK